MKLVLIVDTLQFFRDVFRSQLLAQLLADPETSVIIGTTLEPAAIQKEFQHERLKIVSVTRVKPSWLNEWILSLAKDIWTAEKPHSSYTQKRDSLADANRRGWWLRPRRWTAKVLRKLGLSSRCLIRLGEKFGSDPGFSKLLATEKPDAVLFANMIPSDLECLKETKRRGVLLVLVVASWDNPTSKGPLPALPDYVLVWSLEMKKEMQQYHDVLENQIAVVGVLYFESYFAPEKLMLRDAFCASIGVTPEHKVIHFATGDSAVMKCNQPFIRILHRIIQSGVLGCACHLLVRVSPKDIFSLYKEFEGLSKLTVQYPLGEGSVYGWHSFIPAADEDFNRASTIKNSDVILSVSSSMVLDAACFDIPTINLAYDAGLAVVPWESVERFYRYTHALPVLEEHATWVVKDEPALVEALKICLSHPEAKRAERRKLLERVVGFTDGQTHVRFVNAIKAFVNHRRAE